jgi:hypothetical protein
MFLSRKNVLEIHENRKNNTVRESIHLREIVDQCSSLTRFDDNYVYDLIDRVLSSKVWCDILNIIRQWAHFQNDTLLQSHFDTAKANLQSSANADLSWRACQKQSFQSNARALTKWNKVLELDEYLSIYHAILSSLIESFSDIEQRVNLFFISQELFFWATYDVFWIVDLRSQSCLKRHFDFRDRRDFDKARAFYDH